MKTLTKEQIELLKNEDVKAIVTAYETYLNEKTQLPSYQFNSFASQFTVEPEWSILKYVNKDKYCSVEPHNYCPLCDAECTPYSVQYKSETLTVGDETNCGVITGFKVVYNKMRVMWTGSVCNQWADISEVKKIERKLRFVTNGDGEEIFDGELFYWVESIDWSIQSAICTDDMQGKQIERTYFKSKEKATEYVLLNSPKLSVNNLIDIYDSVDQPVKLIHRDEFIYRANQFVKSKQC